MSGKIVVVGSSNTDFIMKMDRLPRKGETVTNATFVQTFGGKGANTAVGAARAGGDVTFVNCVGDDLFGPIIVENMRRLGIDTRYMVHASGIASGSALVMIDARGDNYLSVAPGSNYLLQPHHVEALRDLIAQAALVMVQYEITLETLCATIYLAAELGRPLLFNYAPAREFDRGDFAKVAYLVVNEIEAEALCGFPVDSPDQARSAAHALLGLGPRVAVITLGGRGVYAADATGSYYVPALPVEVVDTTAAGDIFCGTLGVALVENHPLEHCLHFANTAAALSVSRLGAQPSAPLRAEIEARLPH